MASENRNFFQKPIGHATLLLFQPEDSVACFTIAGLHFIMGCVQQEPANIYKRTRPLDIHVHIAGNGKSGSGCWLRLGAARKIMARLMLKNIKLNLPIEHPDFDEAYVEQLAGWLKKSSLGAVVILAHDNAYDDHGRIMEGIGGFYVPNQYVLDLARKYPGFLPGVSIHPGRPDAMDELERCLAGGAVLMKCLPNCQNINCRDPRYTRFWERMAEAGLPLLAHTGGEHTLPVVNKSYSNPVYLERPLECGVTVIAAHCATKSGIFDPDYFKRFAAMTEDFPGFYGDTSALNMPVRGRRIRHCLSEPLASCLVHGSDYPVPITPFWAWLGGNLRWRMYRRCRQIENPLEKDYQIKLAMGFPPEHFTRAWELLRPEAIGKKVKG